MTDYPDVSLPPRSVSCWAIIFEQLCAELGFRPDLVIHNQAPRVGWTDPDDVIQS